MSGFLSGVFEFSNPAGKTLLHGFVEPNDPNLPGWWRIHCPGKVYLLGVSGEDFIKRVQAQAPQELKTLVDGLRFLSPHLQTELGRDQVPRLSGADQGPAQAISLELSSKLTRVWRGHHTPQQQQKAPPAPSLGALIGHADGSFVRAP